MRFKVKEKIKPKIDDARVVSKFLFFPKKINNEWRWLEQVKYLQKYVKKMDWLGGYYAEWENSSWM